MKKTKPDSRYNPTTMQLYVITVIEILKKYIDVFFFSYVITCMYLYTLNTFRLYV